ncbi:MAG: type II toxin-antitoxin system HicB family antitoxin [Nitrococcus sp.]|nr:type II toxin-antitoxin system HicB family antitoxin [Nitrococcus sp.]
MMWYPVAIEVGTNDTAYGVTLPDLLIQRIDALVSRQPAYKSRSDFLAQAALHERTRDSAA